MLQQYVTSLILKYASKYVKNIQTNVSLWGGDLVFNNLDLRLDVIQRELGVPPAFHFSRGFLKEYE